METCDECGFVFEGVERHEIARRVAAGGEAIAALLVGEPARALVRPRAERWSTVEYGAHVRDVMLAIRDRLVVGLVEDDPGFKPVYRDERLSLGLYRADTASAVAQEIASAAAMFGRLFDAIDPAMLERPVRYGFPDPQRRTLLWMGRQTVHETEHHLGDVRENLRLVAGSDG
jgi:S-DNA-T family DNA segregation ATPase FtsK/SpoIIIE